jgi:[ribosomal protein S5]-alanine N-acetyltransferase
VSEGTSFDLETDRLSLRPLAPRDAEALHALWTDTDVRRYLWDGESVPFEQTAAVIGESARLFATEGRGLWGAWTRDGHALCGFGGFWYFRDPPELELLYGLHRAYWGHGYATEIARTVVEFGFTRVAMAEVRASTDGPNVASVRVLERLGFTLERRATVRGLDTLFFRHSRPA